jgi:hypothetical protein
MRCVVQEQVGKTCAELGESLKPYPRISRIHTNGFGKSVAENPGHSISLAKVFGEGKMDTCDNLTRHGRRCRGRKAFAPECKSVAEHPGHSISLAKVFGEGKMDTCDNLRKAFAEEL